MFARRPSHVDRPPVRPRWAALVLALAEVGLYLRYRDLYRGFRNAVKYHARFAYPRSYREKTNWRKLFDRNPLLVEMQDKLRAKALMARLAPDIRSPRVLWEGDEPPPPELLARLEGPAVLKAAHGCHMNLELTPELLPDAAALAAQARALLARRWGAEKREWVYGAIAPRLFVEDWLAQADGAPAAEYKFCMMGQEVVHITAQTGRIGTRRYGYYDENWRRLPMLVGDGSAGEDVPPPASLERMLAAARAAGGLVDQIRVDFYEVDGEPWFGEFTIYSVSGLLPLRPRAVDFDWGARWDLRRSWFFAADPGPPLRLYRAALRAAIAHEEARDAASAAGRDADPAATG